MAAALVLVLAFSATSVGCVDKPTMQVKEAHVSGVGFAGVGLNVVSRIENRNSFDIMVRRVRGQVTIANLPPMPPIDTQPNVWLPAGQTTEVATPVVIPWTYVLPLLHQTVGSDRIPYRMQGQADVTATRALGVRVNNEVIDESGVIPRQMVLNAARVNYPQVR